MAATPPQTTLPRPAPHVPPSTPSPWRAWCSLVWLSWQRQARARQMVWIALGLLTFTAIFIAINTAANRWDMHRWRWFPPSKEGGYAPAQPYGEVADNVQALLLAFPRGPGLSTIEHAYTGAVQSVLDQSPFLVFTNG